MSEDVSVDASLEGETDDRTVRWVADLQGEPAVSLTCVDGDLDGTVVSKVDLPAGRSKSCVEGQDLLAGGLGPCENGAEELNLD